MRRAIFALLIALVVASPVTLAHASIIPVVLHFSDPAWSGSVSFDDTTGQPWTLAPAIITAYAIVDMDISDGVHTWTENELDPGDVPPDGGLLVDPFGRAALFATATDTATDAGLGTAVTIDLVDSRITVTALVSFNDVVDVSQYTASVPEPATLLLLASGLAGLGGIAWRRRR